MAFLDSTVVNVALPAMAEDLDADLADLKWVVDAYLVTLTALLLLGGALGDRYGRKRVFVIGAAGFAVASALCGSAPTTDTLIGARAVQGVAAALLVPGSLALLSATIRQEDRGRAIGAWSGLAGVASAAGPFVGGWLVDAASWRWAFLINVPLGVGVLLAARHVPESLDADAPQRLDVRGATVVALGLASLTAGLIEAGGEWSAPTIVAVIVGLILLVTFVLVERRSRSPMLPLQLFRSSQFVGANLVTLAVYAGLGGVFFFVVVNLQGALGYSALESGAALTPATAVMLLLSARMGALSQKIGPRIPMTIGPAIAAIGLALSAGSRRAMTTSRPCFPRSSPSASGWRSRSRRSRRRCSVQSTNATSAWAQEPTTRSHDSRDCSRSQSCRRSLGSSSPATRVHFPATRRPCASRPGSRSQVP
jgi:EmrB/QacA subfamily drug resistance transporter